MPTRLDEVIGKTLEKDRALRYQHAADLRADLQRLRRDTASGGAAPSGAAASPAAPAWWRGKLGVAGAAVLLAALAMASWHYADAPEKAIDSVAVLPFVNGSGNPVSRVDCP